MVRYTVSLLDRLFDDKPDEPDDDDLAAREFHCLQQVVTRDVENLLNTRSELSIDFAIYPELARSVLTYGLPDFSHMSPNSAEDCQKVCDLVATIIARFEPRLKHVAIELKNSGDRQSRRDFAFQINALLMTDPEPENIVFDAILESATQRFRVIE